MYGMRIVDAHCHLGEGRYKKSDPASLIRSMDAAGIEKSVIVPVEEQITVYNEAGNELMLKAVSEYRDRLIGFGTVNPWYGAKGTDMIRRYLDRGLRGIKLNSAIQGFLMNDEIVYGVVEAAREYQVPIYFHTGTPIHALPFQLRDLALNYPEVNFIMGHMGAYDFGYNIIHASQGLDNIYLETSLNLSCSISHAIKEAGAKRVIFGSDSPRSTQKFELEKLLAACQDQEDLEKILAQNILSLLRC